MNKNKKSILENDLILVYIDSRPSFFARVENIFPDIKPGWWCVKLLMLQVPVVVTTWILDNEQIRGAEFTMSGTPVRIEKVSVPKEATSKTPKTDPTPKTKKLSSQKASILTLNKNSPDE